MNVKPVEDYADAASEADGIESDTQTGFAFSRSSMTRDVQTLNVPETIAALAEWEAESVQCKHVPYQPAAVSVASKLIADCHGVKTFAALAQLRSSTICGMVSSNVWHLLHMIQCEVSATGKTTISGELLGGSRLTSVNAVGPTMKFRFDYATYLVKSLCDNDDDEWPFTAGAHIAKPTLTR